MKGISKFILPAVFSVVCSAAVAEDIDVNGQIEGNIDVETYENMLLLEQNKFMQQEEVQTLDEDSLEDLD